MVEGTVLAEATRGVFCENRHHGWLIVANTQGHILYSTPGACELTTFFRSAAKPFQALPLVLAGFHKNLPSEMLALACASHVASSTHLMWVHRLLEKANLTADALRCGIQAPQDPETMADLIRSDQKPSAIHHNCSGKHAGMLYGCVQQGWDLEQYLNFEHPLQRQILDQLIQLTGLTTIERAVDGCGAPVFYMPLITMAQLYAWLGTESLAQPLVEAMIQFPTLIGGVGRVDTVIMEASGGQLAAKVGADGVMVVTRVHSGEGMAIKISDGVPEARNRIMVAALEKLGWLTKPMLHYPGLQPYREKTRYNAQKQAIGEWIFHLP